LGHVKQRDAGMKTKTGMMLGLGESWEEVLDTLADLRDQGVDFLTLGQYLQPDSKRYLPVVRYWTPDEFAQLGRAAEQMGFDKVASGPFVRSSYHAREMAEAF
jgi:lipoic acid synthetase